MKWNKASYGVSGAPDESSKKGPSLEWTLANLDIIKKSAGDKPMLLFIESREVIKSTTKSKKKRAPRQTTQAKNSVRVDDAVFKHDKYRLPITTGIFNCYRMDVTSIDAETSKVLNSAKAPMIAVFAKDGTLQGAYQGSRASLSSVYGCMRKHMKPQGVDLDLMYKEIFGLLDDLYRAEVKYYNTKQKVGKDRARYNKLKTKSAAAKARLAKAEKTVTDAKAVCDGIRAKAKEIIAKYDRIAKEASSKSS